MRPKGRRLIWEQQSLQARKKGVLYELWQKGAVWGQVVVAAVGQNS